MKPELPSNAVPHVTILIARMRPGRRATRAMLAGLAGAISVGVLAAEPTSEPYQGIVDRNVFSLREMPKPEPPPPPPAAVSKLALTGITTILGTKSALITAQVAPKPPEPARQESYMLSEGQREGGIEVLSIDEKNGVVRVKNNEVPETLDFVNNGAKQIVSAAPALPLPGVPQTMGMPGQPQRGLPPGGGMRVLPPPRNIRSQNPGSEGQPMPGIAGSNPSTALAAHPQFQHRIPAEEQTLLIEAQRLNLLQQGNHEQANLFPITEATAEVTGQTLEAPPAPQ